MKILFIISRFWPFVGGFEYHVYQLAENLVKSGHSITVLTTDSLVTSPSVETLKGIKIIRKKSFGMVPFTRIPISPGIYDLPKEKFDIVNVFGCIPLISDITLIKAKKRGLKTVYTHIFDPIGNEIIANSPLYWVYRLFAKFIVRKYSDKIITFTEDYARNSDFIQNLEVSVIPSGVNTNLFFPLKNSEKEKIRKKYNLKGRKVLLFVGRLDKYKGLRYLIDSLNYLKRKDIILLIVGNGDEKKNLDKQIARQNLKENVKFFSKLDDKELAKIYNIADVFILPSINRQEVFGKVLIEAMACKIPVISTDLLGVREVVKDCGLIVKRKDSKQLARAISKLLNDDKLREKLSSNGLRKVKEKYNWAKIVKSTIKIYQELSFSP